MLYLSAISLLFAANTSVLITIAIFAIVIILSLVVLAIFVKYFRLWIQCVTTRAQIGIFDLLGMTFRKVNPKIIVHSKIMAVQSGEQ